MTEPTEVLEESKLSVSSSPSANNIKQSSLESDPTVQEEEYPDGGLKAWSVAIGSAGVLFCTMGYANSWG
jgi:hypothetical protein